MFKIMNIEKVNEKYGRDIGTELIVEISNIIKRSISSEYIFVRYMGPKFAIAFSGADIAGVETFVKSMKEEIEELKIEKQQNEETKDSRKKKTLSGASAITNFVLATYYKGTGLEEVTKKLEEYLDDCDQNESNINCI